MPKWVGISLGDVTGIGPEVTLKALATVVGEDQTRYLLIGDRGHLERFNARVGIPLEPFEGYGAEGRVFVLDPLEEALPLELTKGSPSAACAAVEWVREGAIRCLRQELAALVTAPVSKEHIMRGGVPFIGQTEYLSELAGTTRTVMMLLGQDSLGRWLRVALATTHVPLKLVPEMLSVEKVLLGIELAARACGDLGIPRGRVGVCGLNPHAGEGGAFGDEEQRIIRPAIETALDHGLDVAGPLPADSVFYNALRGHYDAVVAMYHDQGLAPLKTVAFSSGVNWTLGLPFVRTSPDHGTAYDIAGKDAADPSSMIAAVRLARQLARSLH